MSKVAILLSTYNGELFLKKQIDSILNQSFQDFTLYIRDDGSLDSTLSILKKYQQNDSRIFLHPVSKNLGVIKSFEFLLQEHIQYSYFMFCDQDDIWDREKISRSYNEMLLLENKHPPNTPLLIHSDLKVIDENDKAIHSSFKKYTQIFHQDIDQEKFLLIQNFVTGCTTFFNSPLAKISLPFPEKILMHDAWVALLASFVGVIGFINEPLILYRQHSKNVSGGAQNRYNTKAIRTLFTEWHSLTQILELRLSQAQELRKRLDRENFSSEKISVLSEFIEALELGGLSGIQKIRKLKIRPQKTLREILFYLLILRLRS